MKKIAMILIGLSFLSFASHPQLLPYDQLQTPVIKKRLSEPVKVITLYAGSILLDAAGDALNDSQHKDWGHLCNAASVGILLTSPFIIDYEKSKWAWYLTSYIGLRIAIFDYTYNTVRGLPLNYIGNNSNWDYFMRKLNPPDFYLGRSVAFVIGVSIPINELRRK